ncbi:MAG: FAD-dependent oxidoreductase [Firmicutes bacterium]|nr:FAD-dependent oxidoreductase [Bacillota bacterium]
MERKFPNLCKPIRIGNVWYRNRMFSTPMGGTDIENDGCIGPKSTAFYEYRAKGGAAAVTVSELMVHPATDGSHAYHLDESILNSLAKATYTADAIRRHGAIPSMELSHSGMFAGTYMTDKNKSHGLAQWSADDGVRADGVPYKALSKEQIQEIVAAYGHVAGLCKRAGFEMVMVHAGHGWLLNQFLTPMYNHRTDEYGGSTENRCRFTIEVLKAVRAAVGPGFPIELRLSGAEFVPEGYDLDEGIRIAKILEPYVDLLHVTAGTYQRTFGITHPSMFEDHGRNVYLAAEIKKHVSVPVATLGGLTDPEQMEEIIASGQADIVEMGRQLLADPFLPQKVMENREEEIVHCMRCFVCMSERAATSTRRCAVNPIIGREDEGMEIIPAPVKKRVLIAGGGPGGLYAAYTAARRGHDVLLCEKEDRVGGILKSEEVLPFKQEMFRLGDSLRILAEKAGAKILTGQEVTKEFAEAYQPDALIIAVGSSPLRPAIPGLDGENVIVVNDLYKHEKPVTDSVVVFGGGISGAECAVHMGMEGKQVHLVEMRDDVALDAVIRQRPLLLEKLGKFCTVHTGYRGLEVTSEGIWCETKAGEKVLVPGTTVICALGQRPNQKIVEELIDCAPFVRVIGDANSVGTITKATYQGHHAALDI